MATATSTKPKRINKYVLKIPVAFKNLSVGDETTTLGFSVIRERLNIDAAEQAFCGKRLKVCILVGAGSDPDQGALWDDVQYRVDGIADAKKFSVTPKLINSSLKFTLSGVDVEELSHFAKRDGILIVTKVTDAADEADPEEKDEDDPDADDNE